MIEINIEIMDGGSCAVWKCQGRCTSKCTSGCNDNLCHDYCKIGTGGNITIGCLGCDHACDGDCRSTGSCHYGCKSGCSGKKKTPPIKEEPAAN